MKPPARCILCFCMPEDLSCHTFMAAGSSERNWKPAMLRREKIRATSCSENLHARFKLYKLLPYPPRTCNNQTQCRDIRFQGDRGCR